jgi:hypothetical protein
MNKKVKFLNLKDEKFFYNASLLLRSIIMLLDQEKYGFSSPRQKLLSKQLRSLIKEFKLIDEKYKLTKK